MTVTTADVKESELKIRKTAAIVGGIQAFTWIILSLICIIYYIKPTDYPYPNSYTSYISYVIYDLFLNSDAISFPKQAFTPTVFFVFMWVYLVLDIVWLVLSNKIFRRKNVGTQIAKDTKLWSYTTFFICGLDFVTVCILGSDYGHCMDINYIYGQSIEEICANGILIPLVIAAKGFVLWIINVLFAKVILNMSHRLRASAMYENPPIHPQMGQPYGYVIPNNPQVWNTAPGPYIAYPQGMSPQPPPYPHVYTQMAPPQQPYPQQMSPPPQPPPQGEPTPTK